MIKFYWIEYTFTCEAVQVGSMVTPDPSGVQGETGNPQKVCIFLVY